MNSAEGEAGFSGGIVGWVTPADRLPEVPKGADCWCIVAVKRANNPKVWVMPGCYANEYPIFHDDPEDRIGNGWLHLELAEDANDDGDVLATGWFSPHASSGEYDHVYEPLLEKGDELVAWMPMPAPPNANSSPKSAE